MESGARLVSFSWRCISRVSHNGTVTLRMSLCRAAFRELSCCPPVWESPSPTGPGPHFCFPRRPGPEHIQGLEAHDQKEHLPHAGRGPLVRVRA